mgnify:CR=1 FL=1
MSWKKHFRVPSGDTDGTYSPVGSNAAYTNYASQLPDVYVGHPNRIERYSQYENMDGDSEINASLDIIAEFCTQTNVENGTAFNFDFDEPPTPSEIDILKSELLSWWRLNDFDRRVFKIFRNTIKYGDQVFVRDPETFEWYWVQMLNVTKVVVNESEGKKPEIYYIKDINPNFQTLTITQQTQKQIQTQIPASGHNPSYLSPSGSAGALGSGGSRFEQNMNEMPIAAEHVVHTSLTEGLDVNWPFGSSILENIFKVFKQKELLEDAVLIYRVQRAPERRVFYIDVGNMPSHMAMSFIERFKNEIHQRRIPSKTGGGTNMMDTAYNPLSIHEDYFFAQTADGRGSKVDTLPGGQNLGDIDDLKFWNNKMMRGLRIPSSYLPTGPEDGTAQFNDGRLGTALIQEKRFNEYCKRLQNYISPVFDQEFKMYLAWRGYDIDSSLFELKFNEPQNFAAYREVEVDNARIGTFSSLSDIPYFSKRFLMKRYLGMSEEEINENASLWREENVEEPTGGEDDAMRAAGISPGAIESDIDLAEPDIDDLDDLGDPGDAAASGVGAPESQGPVDSV